MLVVLQQVFLLKFRFLDLRRVVQKTTRRKGTKNTTHDSYLVDPASSHMLVSKIKPCMSKYKQFYTVKLQMAH